MENSVTQRRKGAENTRKETFDFLCVTSAPLRWILTLFLRE